MTYTYQTTSKQHADKQSTSANNDLVDFNPVAVAFWSLHLLRIPVFVCHVT